MKNFIKAQYTKHIRNNLEKMFRLYSLTIWLRSWKNSLLEYCTSFSYKCYLSNASEMNEISYYSMQRTKFFKEIITHNSTIDLYFCYLTRPSCPFKVIIFFLWFGNKLRILSQSTILKNYSSTLHSKPSLTFFCYETNNL